MEDRPIKVLLIEDNPGDVQFIQEMLAEAGGGDARFELECVDQLTAGLVRLAANDIGVVLLDLDLPDSQGLATFAKAYAQSPRVPIVVMSGCADEDLAIKTVQEGAQDYLVKGQINSDLLVRAISSAIEHKRAEETLRAQALIFENIHDSIVMTDLEGNIIRWNPAAERMFGYYKDEVFRKTLGTLTTKIIKGKLRDGRWAGEMGFTRKDGTEGICETTVIPLCDERGTITAVCAVSHDITDRKQTEEALRKSEEKYRSIIENIQEGYFENDLAGNFTFVNDALCKRFGYPREELIGKNNRQYTDEKTAKKIYQVYNRIYRTGEPSKGIEEEYIRKDGTKATYELSVSLISDAEGKPIGFRGISHDITERKQAEEKMKRLATVVRDSNDAITVQDFEGRITSWNHGAELMYGYSEEEALKMNIGRLTPPTKDAEQKEFTRRLIAEETVTSLETQRVTKEGRILDVWLTVTKLMDDTGKPIGIASTERDVTERKQAEEALRESEERYRVLFEEARDGIALADADTGILLDCNQALADLNGRNRAELIGQHQAILHPPSSNNTGLSTTFKKHLTNKKGQVLETQVLTVTGEIREVEIKANLLYLQGRKMLQGIFRDITERKQAEEALRKSEEKYRGIIENIQEGYFENDLAGNFTFFNDALCRIIGYPREELIGKNNRQYTDEKTAKKIYQVYNRIYRTGEPSKGIEEEYIRKDGTKLFAELSVSLISDAEGKPIGFRGIARDVSERKQADESLRLSEEKYRLVVENAKEAIIITQDVKLVFVNRAGEDMIGYSGEILTSKPFTDFIHPDDRNMVADHHIRRIKGEEVPPVYSFRILSQDGTVKWVELNAAVIQWKERPATLNFLNDITERKQSEEALRESETRFRTLFEAIPDTVLVYDDEGTILHINEIGVQQLEWSAKDLVGRNLREIVTPENGASIADHIRETHKVGWCRFETTYVARSGWQIVAEVNERFIKVGKVKAILSVARDITERKEAESALLKEKDFSDAVINSSPGLLFVIGDKGNTIQWNMNVEIVTGYSAKEISKMNVLDFVAKEDQKAAAEAVQEALTKGQASLEINVLSKPGKKTPFHIIGLRTKFENTTCIVCTGIDITERKLAEDALKNSEEKYRAILENIEDGYYEVDLNGNFTFFNASMCRILGYPQEEMMGMNNRQFTDKDNAKKLFKTFNEVYRTGEPTKEFDWQIIRKDGTKRCIEVSISLRKDSSGKPIGFRGVARDITERKQAEEALRESEIRYRTLFQASSDGILIADFETKAFKYANPAACRLLGYSVTELTTMGVAAIHPKTDLPRVMAEFEAQSRGDKTVAADLPCLRKDGTIVYAYVVAGAMTIDGRTCAVGFFRDITERKQAEETLRESEERFRLAVNATQDGIWEWDILTNQEYFSSRWCEIVGYSFDDPELQHTFNSWAERIHPDDFERVTTVLKNHLEKGTKYDVDYRHRHKSGEYRWQNSRGQAIFDESGKPTKMVGCISDITERKQAEEELQRSYHKLRETLIATVNTLASTVEMRDQYTAGHQRRVTMLACAIAEEMGLTEEQFDGLRLAGLVHDIGKIAVPAEILSKPGRISETEFNIIKTHPQAGYNVLKDIEFPWPVAQIVLQHHERLDGSGYPQGLKNGGIMLEAKILAVADVVEAMASNRPYRPALGIEAALEEITKNRGVLYDPEVADVCTRLFIDKGFALGQEM